MRFSFWRWIRSRSPQTIRRGRPTPPPRTRPALEWLETRDLLTTFSPLYVLEPPQGSAAPMSGSGPTGYSPSQVSQAYGFNQINFNGVTGNGSGETIAIVDAYDDPNIASDLQVFDQQYGLPAPPSFTKVNQTGGSTMPAPSTSWASETALDVEWAHAMAPAANILLVEANSAYDSDLYTAVQYAASQPGVAVVSMSWGGSEYSGETSNDSVFTTPAGHSGVVFVAASGDYGAPPSYPAVSPNVLSVGGTSLYLTSSNNWSSESAWSGSGGGISAYEPQPSYQNGVVTQSTTMRTNPDVAYDANPSTGFSEYNSYTYPSAPWQQFGGTSDAAPQWAALIAIADQGRALNNATPLDGVSQLLPMLYQLPSSDFHDITSGTSTGSPQYSAGPGYDLATGRGSPIANLVVSGLVPSSQSTGTSIIIDNGQSGYSETGSGWQSWSNGYNGSERYHAAGTGADTAVWQASNLAAGTYTVSATWPASASHASNATYQIYDGNGNLLATSTVNQQQNPSGTAVNGWNFQNLATVTLSNPGSLKVVLSDNANGQVVADAVQVVSGSPPPAPTIIDNGASGYSETGSGWQSWSNGYNGSERYHAAGTGADTATWQDSNLAAGTYTISATWPASANHASNATYKIYDGNGNLLATATVNQQQTPTGTAVNGWNFQTLATVTLSSAGSLKVVLSDNANGQVVADAVQFAPSTSSSSTSHVVTGSSNKASATTRAVSATDSTAGSNGSSALGSGAFGSLAGISPSLSLVGLDGGDFLGAMEGSQPSQASQPESNSGPVILGDGSSGSSKTGPGWQWGATGYNGGAHPGTSGSGDDPVS